MKKRLTFIVLLLGLIMSMGCSKEDDASEGGLPFLPDPNDIGSCMDDIVFMKYCYEHFDANKDRKISKKEAETVTEIDLTGLDVKTLTGIEYFANLEILNCKDCEKLTSVNLSNNPKIQVGYEMFYGCSSLTGIILPKAIVKIEEQAFMYCSSLTEIVLPKTVVEIGGSAFDRCSSLTNINIPQGVTKLENCVFWGCESLNNIVLPDGIISIGYAAFEKCSSLKSVVLPKNIVRIPGRAFSRCDALTSVVIPENVTFVDSYAFLDCKNQLDIYCKATTPPSIDGCYYKFILYVPAQSIEAYKNSPWSNYYSSIKAIE